MNKMIQDLLHPEAYPDKPQTINLVQTHISIVFLGEKFVYKIKKPVCFGFLDFSTLEKRKYYCQKEVALNNRFSQDVYLDVLPVTYNGKIHTLQGSGTIVDYAVKMKRLPDEELFKNRFFNGAVSNSDIKKISTAIATFHNNALQTEKIKEFGSLTSVKYNTDENFQQTVEFIGKSISKQQYIDLKQWSDQFYKDKKDLFSKRVKNGKIRDCHGDLHMEHICLTDPIVIFDCIEFNDRFRYSDILSDIAFLLMDLEVNKGNKLADQLLGNYLRQINENHDSTVFDLIKFYKIYRAYVRGKVSSFMLNDPTISDIEKYKAKQLAQRYFDLAHSYIHQ
ncbi:MAG: hypothetical protein R6V50_06625 [Thermoplasmatota archaeon]